MKTSRKRALASQLTDPPTDPNENFDGPVLGSAPTTFSSVITYSPTDPISRFEYRHFHSILSEHLGASEA